MADDAPDTPMLNPRDVMNVVRGAFADMAVVLADPTRMIDPRSILAEMERIAQFVQQLPIPQVHQPDGSEARPN